MKNQKQFIQQMFVALHNALSNPALLSMLSKFNYNEKRLNEGMSGLQKLKSLGQLRDEASEQSRMATARLNQTKSTLLALFNVHLETARLAYKREAEYEDHLKICGRRKNATTEWLSQAERFYATVPQPMMEKYHVPQEELTQTHQMVQQVMELIAMQSSAKAKVQDLTQQRNQQLEAMKHWMQQFLKIAQIALSENPQQMEAMGIVVPS